MRCLRSVKIRKKINKTKAHEKTNHSKVILVFISLSTILLSGILMNFSDIDSTDNQFSMPESIAIDIGQVSLENDSEIIAAIIKRIYMKDEYQSYMQQEDFDVLIDIFEQERDLLELIMAKMTDGGEKAIAFNATNSYAKSFTEEMPHNKSLVLKKDKLSLFYSAPNLFWSVVMDPGLSASLKQINANKNIEFIIIDSNYMLVFLKEDYFEPSYNAYYMYSRNEYNPSYIYGIQIGKGWNLEIIKVYSMYERLSCISESKGNQEGTFPRKNEQKYFKEQSVDYAKIKQIFDKNYTYLKLISNEQIPENVEFLGKQWKEQLQYVPGSEFLQNYTNFYFINQNDSYQNKCIYNEVAENEQLHNMFNLIGEAGEIRSIQVIDQNVRITLAGYYFKEEQVIDFYYIKDMDSVEYTEDMLIAPNWLLYIRPLSEGEQFSQKE